MSRRGTERCFGFLLCSDVCQTPRAVVAQFAHPTTILCFLCHLVPVRIRPDRRLESRVDRLVCLAGRVVKSPPLQNRPKIKM